jgi:creatinine amidohydrolase
MENETLSDNTITSDLTSSRISSQGRKLLPLELPVVFCYTPERNSQSQYFEEKWNQLKQTKEDGHAGEQETSVILAILPELVKMEDLPEKPGAALRRLKHLPDLGTPVNWYSDYPDHYAGDGHYGTVEKGELLMESCVKRMVQVIRAVKADTETERLYKEFFSRIGH